MEPKWAGSVQRRTLSNAFQDPTSYVHLISNREIHREPFYNVFDWGKFCAYSSYLRKKFTGMSNVTHIATATTATAPPPPTTTTTTTTTNTTATSAPRATMTATTATAPLPTTTTTTTVTSAPRKKSKPWKGSHEREMIRQQLMKPSSVINSWTTKEIYDSHSRFSDNFLWKDFKRNVDNLRATTEWLLQIAAEENDLFALHMRLFPETLITNTGCPVWHTHPAKDLLEKDVANGLHLDFKPAELWEMRDEYMEFTLKVFGKHVHQEKSKQIQEPYWVVKRNKMARKIFADDAKKMATKWIEDGDD
eukprot:g758.t1 g758   contig10:676048-676965(-)